MEYICIQMVQKRTRILFLRRGCYIVDHALSIGIIAPLIIFDSSEAKNAMPRATSSTPMTGTGVPSLSFETCNCTIGLCTSVGTYDGEQVDSQEGVEACGIKLVHLHRRRDVCRNAARKHTIAPNAVLVEAPRYVLCRSDLFPHKHCTCKVSIETRTSPCLLAVYAIPAEAPDTPALLATLTIDPLFCSFMNGRTAFINRIGTVRLIDMTRSHSSS
jgi:hypothetical protein